MDKDSHNVRYDHAESSDNRRHEEQQNIESHETINPIAHGNEPVSYPYDETKLHTAPISDTPDFPPANLLTQREPTYIQSNYADGAVGDSTQTPSGDTNKESQPRSARKRLVAIGAGLMAVVAGAGIYVAATEGGTNNSKPNAIASNAGNSKANSANKTPSTNASTSESSPTSNVYNPAQIERLKQSIPAYAAIDQNSPYGSAGTIDAIYSDIQLANQTGEIKFLQAALGGNNMTGDLSKLYVEDMNNDQEYFAAHPTEITTYSYKPRNIRQSAPDSASWYITVDETTNGNTVTSDQLITLAQYTNPNGNQQWVLNNVQSLG